MQTKKYLAALLPLTVLFTSNVFAEGDTGDDENITVTPVTVNGGTVNFTGSIVNAPCVVDVSSENHTVTLGQYRTDSFSGTGSVSSPVDFKINLINCTTDTYTSAAVTFTGSTVSGNSNVLTLSSIQAGDQVAENVGIQILQDSNPVAVDGSAASTAKTISDGTNRLAFQARYIALDDAVTAGAANSSADFTVTYM